MGNNIILCEGETDQTLIGCYMEKTAGWKFEIINNSPFPKEKIIWYKDKNDFKLLKCVSSSAKSSSHNFKISGEASLWS